MVACGRAPKRTTWRRALLLAALWSSPALAAEAPVRLTVLSDRHQEADLPFLQRFTKETGIAVDLVDQESDTLLEQLGHDPKPPADLVLLVGAASLSTLAEAGRLRPIASDAVIAAVPDGMRDPERRWVALAWWARVLAYRQDRFKPEDLARYEDLADPKFMGQILVRSGSSGYNQALVAAMVAADGVEETETWTRQIVGNFARPPQGGDSDQLKALSEGDGGVAIVNTRYWARFAASDKVTELEILEGLGIAFPNQADRGAAVDVVGAGVPRGAPHPAEAERLIAFLLQDEIQQGFAAAAFDYPVRPGVAATPALAALGTFKPDLSALDRLGDLAGDAAAVIAKAGWE